MGSPKNVVWTLAVIEAPTYFRVFLQNIIINVDRFLYQTGEFSSVKSTYFLSELYIFIPKVLDLDSIFWAKKVRTIKHFEFLFN